MNTTLPDPIIAGDTLNFLASADYLASAGWTLKYRLVPLDPLLAAITFNASAEGNDYRVNVAPATTAGWKPGDYQWFSYVTNGTDRHSIDRGRLKLRGDPAAVGSGFDDRSHARRTLDAIEAVLEKRATRDQMEYSINNRTLKRTLMADLLLLRDRYASMVAAEDAAIAGRAKSRISYVRFSRVV